MKATLFTQDFSPLPLNIHKTPFAPVTHHKPEGFMLTGTFLVDKKTKHKGAEGTDLWSNSKIIFIENTNLYLSIKEKQKKYPVKTGY